jgi:hypothetical protein
MPQRKLRQAQGKLREMTDNAVHVSPVATGNAPKDEGFGVRHRRSYLLAIGIGLVMAIIAPLQTDQIPIWPRFAYWQILMLSGATIGLGVTELIERWGKLQRWPWLEVPVIGILIALPLTLIVMGAGAMFFGTSASGVFRFGFNFGVTALISVAITALGHMIHSGKSDTLSASPPATPVINQNEPNRFAARLPLPLRSQRIIALQAEDHYLRVHVSGGQSTLILMRLSDAIAELPADNGAQTHRSWWVAKDAVRGVAKADGRATLMLEGSIEAPVSRSYYKGLGDRGWLN